MIHRHSEEAVKLYYDSTDINQSSLKVLLSEGVQSFVFKRRDLFTTEDLYYGEEKIHFLIGSGVDLILSQGKEVFDEKYFYSKLTKKPADIPLSIVHMVYDRLVALGQPIFELRRYREQLYDAINSHKYYDNRAKPTWQEDTRSETLLKDGVCEAYWEELQDAQGKKVLTSEQHGLINYIVHSLTTHVHTRGLFVDGDDIDIVYQMPIFFNYDNIACKALLDMIVVNHSRKRIAPIDIKTVGDYILKFNKAVRRRRYDLQGAFYSHALKGAIPQLSNIVGKNLTGYSMANFAFIAESTTYPGTPMVFVMSNELMMQGQYGNPADYILGFHHGVKLYREWLEAGFDIQQKFSDSNGILFIDNDYNYNKEF